MKLIDKLLVWLVNKAYKNRPLMWTKYGNMPVDLLVRKDCHQWLENGNVVHRTDYFLNDELVRNDLNILPRGIETTLDQGKVG